MFWSGVKSIISFKIIDSETDMWVCDFFAITFTVHFPTAWSSIDFLRVSFKNLKLKLNPFIFLGQFCYFRILIIQSPMSKEPKTQYTVDINMISIETSHFCSWKQICRVRKISFRHNTYPVSEKTLSNPLCMK